MADCGTVTYIINMNLYKHDLYRFEYYTSRLANQLNAGLASIVAIQFDFFDHLLLLVSHSVYDSFNFYGMEDSKLNYNLNNIETFAV